MFKSVRFMKTVITLFLNTILLLVLLHGSMSGPLCAQEVSLTEEERAWLKAHPDIQFGYTDALEPEVVVNPDGTYSGMVVDFLDDLNGKLGTDFGLRIDSIPNILEKAKTKEVDGILNIHPEYGDSLGLLKTRGYWASYPTVFTRRDVSFKGPDDFGSKRVAIINGVYATEKLIKHYGEEATILKVDNALKGFRSVGKGDADLFLRASFQAYYITKYQLFGLVPAYVFLDYPDKFCLAIRPDWPELVSILNKGIASFSQNDLDAIVAKWTYLPPQKKIIELTAEERAWLAQNHTIRVGFWQHPPFFYIKDGKLVGIAVDFLNKINEITGITFQYENRLDRFSEVLKGLKEYKGPDLVGALMPTIEREKYILFTEPYFSSPRFIFTRDDAPFVSSIENLSGKKVAVVKDYVVHRNLEEHYPDIDLLICNNNEEALRAVASREAFAFIGDLVATPAMINEFGLKNLKASCPSGLPDHPLAMGIRNDWPELRDILRKGLEAIPAYEKAAIMNRWSTVRVEHGIRPADIFQWALIVAGIVALIVLLFAGWTITLNRRVKDRTSSLAQSEEQLRNLIAQSPMSIQIHAPDGRLRQTNAAYAKLWGLNQETVEELHKKYNVLQDEEAKRLGLMPLIEKVFSGEMTFFPPYEYDGISTLKNIGCKKPMARKPWVHSRGFPVKDKDGKILNVVLISEDITERKQAEEALRASENLLKEAHKIARMGSYSGDLRTKKGTWSHEQYHLFGYSPGEIEPSFENTLNHVHPDDREKWMKASMDHIENKAPYEIEYRIVRKDGAIRTLRAWASLKLNDAGTPIRTVGLTQDITERKQAEEELRQSREELLHATRTGTLAEMTAALAHELNHPLGSILNNANAAKRFLEKEKPDLDEIREIISDIISEDRRASDVIRKLRALMKKTQIQFVSLDINQVIEEVLLLTHSDLVIHNISLTKQLEKKLPLINGDRTQLQQLFLNVILNAIDAMEESKTRHITISTAQQRTESIIICVRDTGKGFDEKDKDNLFQPFFTTKKKGMGIGLSVIKTIVKYHAGDAWAENSKEGGASFYLTFPINKEKSS